MRTPHPEQLLRLWEDGMHQTVLEKSVRLLAVSCGTHDLSPIYRMSIGERDARLLQLRIWMFGSRMKNMATCPVCKQLTEWETNTHELQLQSFPTEPAERIFSITMDGYAVRFRLPANADMAIAIADKTFRSEEAILTNCILEVKHEEQLITNEKLPAAVRTAIEKKMSEEDPQADIRMQISCPSCTHTWETRFDIMSYLWTEISNWAKRMVRDIYLLARTFSWSEKDILAMTPQRRQLYLQMIGT